MSVSLIGSCCDGHNVISVQYMPVDEFLCINFVVCILVLANVVLQKGLLMLLSHSHWHFRGMTYFLQLL